MDKSYHPISQRIKNLIEDLSDGNVTFFARTLGLDSPQKINRLFHIDKRTGKYPKPSLDIIKQISNTHSVSLEWLNYGKGERNRDPVETDLIVLLTQKEHLLSESLEDKKKIIAMLEKKNQELETENKQLQKELLETKNKLLDKSLSPD